MQLNQWVKHFLVYGLGVVLMNLLPALMIPIYTYRISPSIYGVVELLNRSQDILILILSFGLRSAVVTFYQMDQGNPKAQRSVYSTSMGFMAVVSLAVILALLPFSPWISKLLFGSRQYDAAVVLILVATYFEVLFQSGVLYIQSELRSLLYVGTYTARSIFAILLNLVLVFWWGWGLMGILWATLIHTSIFAIFVSVYMCRRTGLGFDRKLLKELLVFGMPLMIGGFGGFILNNGDRFFLEAFRSPAEVGLYGVGYRLGTVALALVIQPFLKIWSVTMVDLSRRPDGRNELGRIATYLLAACIFTTLALSLLGPYIVEWITERSYWQAFRTIPIVGLAYIFFAWTIVMDASFYVTKKTIYKLYDIGLASIVILVLYWWLIPRYGMMGAAWATVGGFASYAGFKAFFAQRVFPIHYQLRRIAIMGVLGFLLYEAGAHVATHMVIPGLALRTVLTFAFPTLLWVSGFVSQDERKAFTEYWNTLRTSYLGALTTRTASPGASLATNGNANGSHDAAPHPLVFPNGVNNGKGKLWVKSAIVKSGALKMASHFASRKIVVLYYHSVQDDPARFATIFVPGIVHSSRLFREQMEFIAKRFDPVSMDDVERFLRGEAELPPRPVAVTFDDGYADNYEIAAPILDRVGIQALFNVVVGSIESPRPPWFCRLHYAFMTTRKKCWVDSGTQRTHALVAPADRAAAFRLASQRCARSVDASQAAVISTIEQELEVEPLTTKDCPMMTWSQVRELHQTGHLIGSHSLTHPNLAYVDEEIQWKEISESRIQLGKQLGASIDHFSYPNPIMSPNFSSLTVQSTKRAGYALASTMMTGPVRTGHDPHLIPRVPAPSNMDEFIWATQNTFLGRRL